MNAKRWRTEDGNTTTWHGRFGWRRLQAGYRVHRRTYWESGDRWVLQPSLTWDRKAEP